MKSCCKLSTLIENNAIGTSADCDGRWGGGVGLFDSFVSESCGNFHAQLSSTSSHAYARLSPGAASVVHDDDHGPVPWARGLRRRRAMCGLSRGDHEQLQQDSDGP